MRCLYCESDNIITLKVYINKPTIAKKYKCRDCLKTFIENSDEQTNKTE
jgi:transposase-like protein